MRTEELIDQAIQTIAVPATDVAADVARGERALRRRRTVTAGAGLAAVVAVAATLAATTGPAPSERGEVATTPTPSPDPETVSPEDAAYEALIAALDPEREHEIVGTTSSSPLEVAGELRQYTTGMGWDFRDERPAGSVNLRVAASWYDAEWECDLPCTERAVAGRTAYTFVRPGDRRAPGETATAYEQADGDVLVLTVSEGLELTDTQVDAVLTSEDVDLPGDPTRFPALPAETIDAVMVEVLAPATIDFEKHSTLMSAQAYGTVQHNGRETGEVQVFLVPRIYPGPGKAGCTKWAGKGRCERRTIGGHDVGLYFIGGDPGNPSEGHLSIEFEGAKWRVFVKVTPDGAGWSVPLDRAVALITDPRLQH